MNSDYKENSSKFRIGAKAEATLWFALVAAAGFVALALLLSYGLDLIDKGAQGGLPKEKMDRAFYAAEQAWLEALKTKNTADLTYAENALSGFVQDYPDYAGARNRLADIYELQGRRGESLLERARDLFLLSQGLAESEQAEASRTALDLLSMAEDELGRETVETLAARFDAALLGRDAPLAASALAALETREIAQAELGWLKARLALALGHRDGAIGLLRSAIVDDPDFRPAAVLLARISTSPAEAARAAEALHAALKTRKEDAELWHLLGEAFLRSGRADEAASALEEAWRLAPDNSLTTHRLAEALERTNQSARAVKLRQAARQLNPAPNPPLVYKARK